MKQLYGKLWVKCTAIALLVVFAILFAASALGTAYLFTYGAYADGGEQVRQIAENEILQQTNGDGWTALHAWVDDDKITRDLLRERYDPLTSNIYFKLTDKDTGKILFSTGALNKDDYTGKASAYYQQDMTISLDDGSDVTAVYQAYLKSPLAPNDRALYIMTWVDRLISARYLLIVLAVLLLAVCLFLFIFLLCAMGHKEGVDGIYQCWLNRIPLDLFVLLLVFLSYAWATFVSEIWYINGWYYILLILGTAALALTLIQSVAGRAKAPGFFKNTIVYMVFAWIFRGLGRIPMVWRTMLIWAGFCFIDLLLMFDGSSAAALWWLFSRGVLTVGILYLASSLKLLQKEGQAIADGQTDYKGKPIPRWLPALKKHEENLQSIQSGIQKAVDEQTRAERMKTELITNVSHDIKTPLTSIVNYVDLLEKEDIQPEKAKEYVDVLNRQAARLSDAPLYVGGHSKGGNLAVYAAVKCDAAVQARIERVYNNDGPGFLPAFLSGDDYRRVMDRIVTIVPQSSVVGLLLEHRERHIVVKSGNVGVLQHNSANWAVLGTAFVRAELTAGSQAVDRTLKEWMATLDDDARRKFIDTLFTLLEATGATRIEELTAEGLGGLVRALRRLSAMDAQQKDMLWRAVLTLMRAGNGALYHTLITPGTALLAQGQKRLRSLRARLMHGAPRRE